MAALSSRSRASDVRPIAFTPLDDRSSIHRRMQRVKGWGFFGLSDRRAQLGPPALSRCSYCWCRGVAVQCLRRNRESTWRVIMKRSWLVLVPLAIACAPPAPAATMYSTHLSYMGAGTFYGPGKMSDSVLFDATINNIAFPSPLTFVTPLLNNGATAPNICGERETRQKSTGLLSDNLTRINENVDVCSFQLSDKKILVAVVDGGQHQGEQVAVVLSNGEMLMTMDIALDLGIGPPGIIRLPFNATTGEVTIPQSLQTQLKIPGGIDR